MRSGLFFFSVGLLALGTNLPRTSGQKVTEKLGWEEKVTLTCLADGFGPDASVRWFHNDEAVVSSVNSMTSGKSSQECEIPADHLLCSTLKIQLGDWKRGENFTCLVEPKVLPPLPVLKITDKDRGDPSPSKKAIFRPRFREEEAKTEMFISCIVEGDRPPGASIAWQENRSPLPECTTVDSSSKDPSFMSSTLTLHSTLWRLIGKNYLCNIGY